MIFDTHAHYDDEQFSADRDSLISSFKDGGVSHVLTCGANLKTSVAAVALADKYDFIYASVGVHPEDAGEINEAALLKLKELTKNKKVVAIGEISLDYHYDTPEKDVQKQAFIKQIHLANSLSLPVIIHDRDAHGDCLKILSENPAKSGVFHCFSGSPEMAKEVLKMGYYIAFGGTLTFKNARHTPEVAKMVPLDRILIETDCPYLAPEPFRGKRNSSLYLPYVAEKLAELKGVTREEIENATLKNAKELFNIK